jgi:hypothetical protein
MYVEPMDDMIRQFIGFDLLSWPDLAVPVEKAFATGSGVTPAPTQVTNFGMASLCALPCHGCVRPCSEYHRLLAFPALALVYSLY